MSDEGKDDDVLELDETKKIDPAPNDPKEPAETQPGKAEAAPPLVVPPRPRAIPTDQITSTERPKAQPIPTKPAPSAPGPVKHAGTAPISVKDTDKVTKLVEGASANFTSFGSTAVPVDFEKSLTELTAPERRVVVAAAAGEACDLSDASDKDVRAFVIRRLMLRLPAMTGAAPWPLVGPGVRVRGARIVGSIDLEDGSGPGGSPMAPLLLERCDIPQPIRMSGAHLARLSLKDSRIVELDGGGIRLERGLNLGRVKPIETNAHLFLNGARIGGDVRLEGARLSAPKRSSGETAALDLHGARIEGRILARRDFHCEGKVWLNGANIAGNVDFTRALILHPLADVEAEAEAINLAQARVGGSVLFFAATVSGVTNMRHARIAEDVRVIESTLSNPLRDRARNAIALQASEVETVGSFILREAELEGTVRLASARIGERVELRRCKVDGDVNCSDVHVKGDFEWRGLTLSRSLEAPAPRLSLASARVERLIYATRFSAPSGAIIDLTAARAASLHDRVDHAWGEEGEKVVVEMDGFEYDTLEAPDGEARGRDVVKARMGWLQRQPRKQRDANPQPYAQLARALRASGHRRDASAFELKARKLAAHARERQPVRWITTLFWGMPFGHGLRPERAVLTLALFYLLGVAIAWGIDARGVLMAVAPDGVESACAAHPSPWLYAIDMLAPMVELGANEAEGCRISRQTNEGFAWRVGKVVYQIVGLVLLYLTVLTFTGALKREGQD